MKTLQTLRRERRVNAADAKRLDAAITAAQQSKRLKIYPLNLTFDQVEAMYFILQAVGGHPDTTRRGTSDEVRQKIIDFGLELDDDEAWAAVKGSITFKEGK